MGDFTATRPHVYTTGAVIYAANHNNNENEIYNKHNGAINASTGHKHTGATGDAPKIDSTGLDLTAAYTWTGTHTFSTATITNATLTNIVADTLVNTDKKIQFRDTTNYIYSSAAGKLDQYCNGYRAGSKYNTGSGALYCYYDTSTTTGEIRQFFANSDASVYFEQDYTFTSGDVWWALQSNTKTPLIFSDTNNYFKMQTDVAIQATKKLYFDAATGTAALTGDTFIYESAANVLELVSGNVAALTLTPTTVRLPSQVYLYYDGGGDTYTRESSANVLDTIVGGTRIVRLDSGGMELADIDPPAANYFVRKSGMRGYCNFACTSVSAASSYADFNLAGITCSNYDVALEWDRNFNSVEDCIPTGGGTAGPQNLSIEFLNSSSGGVTTCYAFDLSGPITTVGWYGCVSACGVQV